MYTVYIKKFWRYNAVAAAAGAAVMAAEEAAEAEEEAEAVAGLPTTTTKAVWFPAGSCKKFFAMYFRTSILVP